MNPLKFIKNVAETYFDERAKIQHRSKRWWNLTFTCFFALFLFQIYAAYLDWQTLVVRQAIDGEMTINAGLLWQNYASAMFLQGIVLGGIFVRFLFGQFRGRWFVRFGELGELVAFAAFLKQFEWMREIHSHPSLADYCGTQSLIGINPTVGQWLTFFFFCWVIYKFCWMVGITLETVRKNRQRSNAAQI